MRIIVLGLTGILILSVIVASGTLALSLQPTAFDMTPFHGTDDTDSPCVDYEAIEECSSIELDGRSFRYSLDRSSSGAMDTVLVDLGGPGNALLSGRYSLGNVADSIRESIRNNGSRSVDNEAISPDEEYKAEYNVLFVEEPWVTSDANWHCEDSASEFYSAMRSGKWSNVLDHADIMANRCEFGNGTYGFTPDLYRSVIGEISNAEKVDITGFVGYSFGSSRLSYLADPPPRVDITWAILNSPFPVGASSGEITDLRNEKILSPLGSIEISSEIVEMPDRSVPVEEIDRWSALVGSAGMNDEDYREFVALLSQSSDDELIGSISDQLWNRYGVASISPGMVAFFEETCFHGSRADDYNPDSISLEYVLQSLWAPCLHRTEAATVPDIPRFCVSASVDDAVTPIELIHKTYDGFAEIIEIDSRIHGDPKGFDECMARVFQ